MIRNILHRPIAVTMCLIALTVMGMLALRYIAVSLMPDIDIPKITVQTSMPGYSAQEIENDVISPLRGRLIQVAGLKDIRSEARMDIGSIRMTFEPGANIDLLFIEVNEKIDRAMNNMPKEMDRPRIMKASAMDIPAFYMDVCMADQARTSRNSFAQLSRFARNVLSKRIEQLPQTAMVDISGTVGSEIVCIPDFEKLRSMGLQTEDIEAAIKRNNITMSALSVVDGLYRYNIHFDAQLLTVKDIADIYLNQDGRLLQLKDVCTIQEHTAQRNGIVRHAGQDAVTLAVVKQSDAQMEDLQKSMEELIHDLNEEYPDLKFVLTRDQTRLLTYTIENLKSNLYVGALLACLVLLVFMRQWRLSVLIILTIPLSLILTILFFYATGVSLNIISISGLILGEGMIVDNAIIVIDNVMQKKKEGLEWENAVLQGTKEVFTPMLSSVLTTCSVFLPLIFLSGTAGALFYDQAMGVTIALFSSLAVAVLVIPVYLFRWMKKGNDKKGEQKTRKSSDMAFRLYETVMTWTLRHTRFLLLCMIVLLPLSAAIFRVIEKKRMPYVFEEDALMSIDWNQGISTEENDRRIQELLGQTGEDINTYTSMCGTQEFILSHTPDITSSEAIVYLQCKDEEALQRTEYRLTEWLQQHYPRASVEYGQSGNVYDLVFSTDEADLEIHLQTEEGKRPEIAQARAFTDTLQTRFPEVSIMPVLTETNVCYVADMEKMALYKVSYETLHARLKERLSRNRIFQINDGAQAVPVLVGVEGKDSNHILEGTVSNSEGTEIPISYLVHETKSEEYKCLQAAGSGEFYCISINGTDKDMERIMQFVQKYMHRQGCTLTAHYDGGYFSSRNMIHELSFVLCVALMLLYFILAVQFESIIQPLIILLEMVFDVFFVVLILWLMGESLNVMSMIGLVVMSGIVINDSILKVETINRLRRDGESVLHAILHAGRKRLSPIVMTSLTTILALIPFLGHGSMGSALQYPLSLTIIIGMTVGTLVSLFIVPMLYLIVSKITRH